MLDIQDLHVRFRSAPAGKEAVKGISLHMNAGEILGLVGSPAAARPSPPWPWQGCSATPRSS